MFHSRNIFSVLLTLTIGTSTLADGRNKAAGPGRSQEHREHEREGDRGRGHQQGQDREKEKDRDGDDDDDDKDAVDFKDGHGREVNPSHSDYSYHVQIGSPRFSGNGCASSSAQSILSPDKTVLTILFDNYQIEAGGPSLKKMAQRQCGMKIPFSVPQGYRVSIIKTDYRGFTSVPDKGQTKLVTTYQFVNSQNQMELHPPVKIRKLFNGQQTTDFVLNSEVTNEPFWSQCGQGFDFYVETKLVASSNDKNESAQIGIDSLDVSQDQVGYHLLWKKCQ